MIPDILARAYLARLGCPAEAPSVAALHRLHRAQVERIAYETTWIHLGETRGVDQLTSVELVAGRGRGGYCFQLNGALAALLTTLGYEVTVHRGAVHDNDGPHPSDLANHLVVLVHGLPTAANPEGRWYVDAGLGDVLHEPLPLRAGTWTQGPLTVTLAPTGGGIGDWRLTNDPTGSFTAMNFETRPAAIGEFAATHTRLATSPESPFVRMVTAQRRHCAGTTVLRGRLLTVRTTAGVERRPVPDRAEWFALLADEFDLPLADVDPASLDRLWAHAAALPIPEPD